MRRLAVFLVPLFFKKGLKKGLKIDFLTLKMYTFKERQNGQSNRVPHLHL
jgi:hypothetical protein